MSEKYKARGSLGEKDTSTGFKMKLKIWRQEERKNSKKREK